MTEPKQRGRTKGGPRTALDMVVMVEMQRKGQSYRSLARKVTQTLGKMSAQALHRRVTREVPTMDTIEIIAEALGLKERTIRERMRTEVELARSEGRVIPGGGKIQGAIGIDVSLG